jgi:hypothetical protein
MIMSFEKRIEPVISIPLAKTFVAVAMVRSIQQSRRPLAIGEFGHFGGFTIFRADAGVFALEDDVNPRS